MRSAEEFGKDYTNIVDILKEMWNSDWTGYQAPHTSDVEDIRDEALKRMIKAEIPSGEKKRKMYDYMLNLTLEYGESIKENRFVYRDHIPDIFLLIQELCFRKDEETFEITEKILDAIETLYA